MEATVLSIGKSVLSGALGYAKSSVAAEVALQLGVRRDQIFITNELEMMQGFLMTAHDEQDDNKVVKIWVKQVRDVAYDVEDCLLDFVIRFEKQRSWWRIPRTLLERRQVAKQMKELRANVEDISQRNVRYRLIKGPDSKPATTATAGQSSSAAATMFSIDEARHAAKKHPSRLDLTQLINKEGEDLGVIAVWGASGNVGQTSIIWEAYENPDVKENFECQAWVRVLHPFDPKGFIHSLVEEFHTTQGVDFLLETNKSGQELVEEFNGYVNDKRYLVVLNDLSTIEEWNRAKKCFPNNKKGSRIIVSTTHVEVASLCAGPKSVVSELKQLSADQSTYAFYEQLTVVRQKEISEIIKLISKPTCQQFDVISVCGVGVSKNPTVVNDVYQNKELRGMFGRHAFITILQPFKLEKLLTSIAMQLAYPSEIEELSSMGFEELGRLSEGNRCLIVLDCVSSTREWDQIISFFQERTNITGVIVITTRQENIARHCSKKEENIFMVNGLEDKDKQRVTEKNSQERTCSAKQVPTTEILEGSGNKTVEERLTRINTIAGVLEQSHLVGRDKEKSSIVNLIISEQVKHEVKVISVWGMGGLGKTTLVKDVFQSQKLISLFEKRAFATIMRPFKVEELLRSLVKQVQVDASEKEGVMGRKREGVDSMGVTQLVEELDKLTENKRCLIVLDDLSSTTEWDMIRHSFPNKDLSSTTEFDIKKGSFLANSVIVVTTRQEDIAKHCSEQKNICMLRGLEDKDAYDLFTRKVFKKITDLDKQYPELVEPAKQILKKCDGLPLAIVTIGGFLADQPTKTAAEWRKLNEHISAELEMNPKLESIKTVLIKSYDGLPYYLKSCFLYLSIFPEDRNISRRRLVRRWVAEGYSMELRDKSAVEVAEKYFMELMERSMILPAQSSVSSRGVNSCQVHDLIRDISISMSTEQNLVFTLEKGCRSNAHSSVRHLAISSDWDGDEIEFQGKVELSRIRSLTLFGKWKPFYFSDKMRFLRVLDLESMLQDQNISHLGNIGKLLHLGYLSLRGLREINSLPDSVGNLQQLVTLDIKNTSIKKLPKTIIKLRKLRYLHAGWRSGGYRFGGVKMPRGTRQLKDLQTLCDIRLASGKAGLKEINNLSGLRKLGVVGMSKKNGSEFCSTLPNLGCLESLSVSSKPSGYDLNGCLDVIPLSPPANLRSLKLQGWLAMLPEWIGRLHNLVKVKLINTELSLNGAAMEVLGELPNLSIMFLDDICLEGLQFQSGGLFRSLMVLQLDLANVTSVKFNEGAMPKLEILILSHSRILTDVSGLEFLPSIKEVRLSFGSVLDFSQLPKSMSREDKCIESKKRRKTMEDKLKEDLRTKLSKNKNRPILSEHRPY